MGISKRISLEFWRRMVGMLPRRNLKKGLKAVWVVAAWAVLIASVMIYKSTVPPKIDPAAYAPLLDTIARGESKGNYNAYYGNAANTSVRFTDMTVGEVLQWQDEYVRQGSVSNAVGKYQIIRPTLVGLVSELQIDQSEKYDEALQDRLAIALLERRGSVEYAGEKLTREQFAANLAKEWAALPRITGPNPHQSYYAADGINKAHITIEEVYGALGLLRSE